MSEILYEIKVKVLENSLPSINSNSKLEVTLKAYIIYMVELVHIVNHSTYEWTSSLKMLKDLLLFMKAYCDCENVLSI